MTKLNRFDPYVPISRDQAACLGGRVFELEAIYGFLVATFAHVRTVEPVWFPVHPCEHAGWAVEN